MVVLHHLRGLHAKVYIADRSGAIVTSGNLTRGGIETNYEFGLLISGDPEVAAIAEAAESYVALATRVDINPLLDYLAVVESSLQPIPQLIAPAVTRAYQRLFPRRDPRARSAKRKTNQRAPHSMLRRIFAPSILAEINLNGPRSVDELYATIRELYPELCDDATTRGKPPRALWKHEVRFALEELKEDRAIRRLVGLDSKTGKWAVVTVSPH